MTRPGTDTGQPPIADHGATPDAPGAPPAMQGAPTDPASGPLRRRDVLAAGASALAGLSMPAWAGTLNPGSAGQGQIAGAWRSGAVRHLIPTANHERLLIKASFARALAQAPVLSVDGRRVAGSRTDAQGRFWRFDIGGLRAGTTYTLRLLAASGAPLCDAWPLATFPAPNAEPERLRILAYTCAGGYDGLMLNGKTGFLDMAARRRLLARGMALQPDAVIANGDHLYWDQKTWLNKPFAKLIQRDVWPEFGGALDLSLPMLHPRNAAIFTKVCDNQIADLYGTTLRSTPAFFLTDDHDCLENDELDAHVATLPADRYGTLAAEQTQHLYYPEFLPDANRPAWLPGADLPHLPAGCNSGFGTLRYGRLMEAVLYDCRRWLDNKGRHARVVPAWVEDWLVARTRAEDSQHFMHVPSLPFGYSSGKLGDWYPDLLDEASGRLVMGREKEGWQSGWLAQHQRLVAALAAQKQRSGVIVQGDFHASAVARLQGSADLDFARPLHTVMSGTLGTGDMGFPSAYRRIESSPSHLVRMAQTLAPTEKNGFTVIDVTPEKLVFSLYMWRPPEPVEAIDTLAPAVVYDIPRGA